MFLRRREINLNSEIEIDPGPFLGTFTALRYAG
jgi:hypothetical protein